jgi:hypothetical protein
MRTDGQAGMTKSIFAILKIRLKKVIYDNRCYLLGNGLMNIYRRSIVITVPLLGNHYS